MAALSNWLFSSWCKSFESLTWLLSALVLSGTFVDENITPGFYYRVRRIHDSSFLFNGEARRLVSVGMGYGKRITFGGDHVIDNTDFFFYSDTEQEG